MTFGERMKELMEQGLAASKEFAAKAGAKAQDIGERGILMLEIKQLEGQAQKLLTRMGNDAYIAFTEKGQSTIDSEQAEFKNALKEIALIKEAIEKKEAELRERKSV
ncbi:MAG: hypothetical protein LBV17_10085 [Treponema sp.]|jgi:hypothetical protein|nr:hypothetical protein [Treponema sp.]